MIRYHTLLPFPNLDSFPSIFNNAVDGKVSIRASISTSTRISRRIQKLQNVSSFTSNADEREALSNSLGEIAEAYEEGWHNSIEGDSDDD